MEYRVKQQSVTGCDGQDNALTIRLRRLKLPPEWNEWFNADVHTHMNYGGTYQNTSDRLAVQARAEDLDIVFELIVNKE